MAPTYEFIFCTTAGGIIKQKSEYSDVVFSEHFCLANTGVNTSHTSEYLDVMFGCVFKIICECCLTVRLEYEKMLILWCILNWSPHRFIQLCSELVILENG